MKDRVSVEVHIEECSDVPAAVTQALMSIKSENRQEFTQPQTVKLDNNKRTAEFNETLALLSVQLACPSVYSSLSLSGCETYKWESGV